MQLAVVWADSVPTRIGAGDAKLVLEECPIASEPDNAPYAEAVRTLRDWYVADEVDEDSAPDSPEYNHLATSMQEISVLHPSAQSTVANFRNQPELISLPKLASYLSKNFNEPTKTYGPVPKCAKVAGEAVVTIRPVPCV